MTGWPERVAIVSDAWHPQVNGVVRSLGQLVRELRGQGIEVEIFGPDRFSTLPCPFYPEIRLALWPKRRLHRMLRDFRPDALHIATEGPLGLSARRWATGQRYAFTTSFHTRFPEYVAARLPFPPRRDRARGLSLDAVLPPLGLGRHGADAQPDRGADGAGFRQRLPLDPRRRHGRDFTRPCGASRASSSVPYSSMRVGLPSRRTSRPS